MPLSDDLQCVLILDDSQVATRDQAIDVILHRMAEARLFLATLVPAIRNSIMRREELGPTGIGEGVGIPHTWHDGVERTIAALAISRRGLDYESLDHAPVHIVFLVLTPPTVPGGRVGAEVIEDGLRRLRNPAFRASLRQASSSAELWEVIRAADESDS
jgi:mannitol/fructose-specific phosphotransferase system IIA component (Ntr-type)